ncbi:hypothetical protein [Chryseobacterium caseinilyticum]|uniref:Carboxypeptidase regulatory-like domain-containing protein n=1 Tax=Chryseobacterium caseinilyticum TaxID=2771428 RepID=A0ABR8ZHK5_9FLAO|nr:hypothetical protein [Chryseobacterium caseinilyticum]MBD8084340.1 hypothetical protein [Chryseobacterium caseinilyticum]
MNFKFIPVILILLALISCETDYVNNSRVFVEGKITFNNQPFSKAQVSLETFSYPISNALTKSDGTFEMGAPDVAETVHLYIGKKITSFSTDSEDCMIAQDSLSIVLPENFQHVKFSNIMIKQ